MASSRRLEGEVGRSRGMEGMNMLSVSLNRPFPERECTFRVSKFSPKSH